MRSVDAARHRTLLAAAQRVSPGAATLALAIPVLFLHIRYQPAVAVGGSTLKLQDVVIVLVVAAASVAARRNGIGPLRAAWPIWIGSALFLAWIVAATFYPLLSDRSYSWRTHVVTAVEFGLYALLAPAVPLLVRHRSDALLVLGVLVGWCTLASLVGVLQWSGLGIFAAWPQGDRQPSFLGPHDFAALGGMTLLAGLVGILWRTSGAAVRRGAWLALVVGTVGFVLGGATAGIIGLVPAVAFAIAVAARQKLLLRRGVAVTLATVAVASLGIAALRARDFDQFFRFLGAKQTQTSTTVDIQSYSQRTLLAYVGIRIWWNHPIVGVGWQGSTEQSAVGPVLPAAHRRFPDVAPRAFPGTGHQYGVQLLYVQVLADLGIVGFALMLGWLVSPLVIGARASLRAPPTFAWVAALGVCWLVLALGLWVAFGLVAGVPLDALAWLAIGTVAAGAAGATGPSGRMGT